jgi:uncharacterized protein (TIGR02231 family)
MTMNYKGGGMKPWQWVFVVIACTLLPARLNAEAGTAIEAKPGIKGVTVYEDRALVTREAELALEPGQRAIVFKGLPAGLADSSLRAGGKGSAKVVILGLEVEREYLKEPKDERVKALQDEIEKLEEKGRALEDKGKIVEMQMKFVESIKSSVGEGISKEMLMRVPDPSEWENVVAFLGQASGALSPKLREVQKQSRDVKKEIEAAKKKLDQIISAIPKEQKNITVMLDVAQGGAFSLALSCTIHGAGWRPLYDIRAERGAGEIELTYCGQVRQNTGEDWNDVELDLSTAKPSIGGKPPELEPWYVRYLQYRLLERRMAMPMAAAPPGKEASEAVEEAGGVGGPAGEEEARVATAQVERRGEAVTFKVKKRETIPSDNNLHKTTIASFTMKGSYEYVTVPKLAEYAYLVAKVANEAVYPLLGGEANVFLGPEYIGTSELKYVGPGEMFDLYLGVDEGMSVKRKLLTTEAERSTVRWRTGWRNYRYRIEIENHKKGKQTVVILDQIPVSKEPDIKVTLEKAVPGTVTLPEWEKPGALCWKLDVEPGEKKTIEFEFSVSFPKGKEIEGLD